MLLFVADVEAVSVAGSLRSEVLEQGGAGMRTLVDYDGYFALLARSYDACLAPW